ncbi:MAG: Beta-N-acetylhexosaminidase [Microgenomates bacterium 39_7]|nr:MAG: Beta-N-acetylhexosaminidase [Microgenomates bacterium 39_7]
MKKPFSSTTIFIIILAIVALLLGYNYYARPFLRNYPTQVEDEQQEEAVAKDEYVEQKLSLLETMSQQDKVAQLLAYPYLANSDDGNLSATTSAQLTELQPGTVTFFGSDISWQAAQVQIKNIYSLFVTMQVHPLIAVDHEGGNTQRFSGEGFLTLPSWRELCKYDQEDRLELLTDSAEQIWSTGTTVVFAPVLDINSQILGSRSCSNVDDLKQAAIDYITTFGERDRMSVVKHFPGLGNTTRDLHFGPDTIILADGDTKIFSDILNTFPNIGVMSSHVRLEGLFDETPCSMSRDCLSGLIEDFPLALIFSDALEMGALTDYAQELVDEFDFLTLSPEQVEDDLATARLVALSYQAIMAGNNVLVYGEDVTFEQLKAIRDELAVQSQQNEELSEQIELSLIKLLAIKQPHGQ